MMPLRIVRDDITKMKVDAIVNAANESLLGGGGVDGSIHRAAGPALLEECRTLGGCETGKAKITGAGKLPCRYVIHTVGPRWMGGGCGERELLLSCYRASLLLAKEKGCETIAFPLISSGAYGYPKDQAMNAAVEAIRGFLRGNDMNVYLVIFDRESFRIGGQLFDEIAAYIDDTYADAHSENPAMRRKRAFCSEKKAVRPGVSLDADRGPVSVMPAAASNAAFGNGMTLKDALDQLDESFSEMLLRKIDESGMTDAECYKKANIDRKLFSKIRSDKRYRPSKPTAIAFAIALELSLEETKDMLMKAGFALSHSSKFDIIIEYFIEHRDYDIDKINGALFDFHQNQLGA